MIRSCGMLLAGWGMLAEHALDGCRRNAIALGDFSQALATLAVLMDGGTVQHQRVAADVLTVQTCAPHAGTHSFDDEAALKLSDGADDHDDGPGQRAGGVDLLPEAR